jgi:hypothetical protein
MKALKSGKIFKGKLAEIFVKNGSAKEMTDAEVEEFMQSQLIKAKPKAKKEAKPKAKKD